MAELTDVLKSAVQAGASDVHIVVGRPPMIRLHGEILPVPNLPALSEEDTRKMVYSVLYEGQRARFEADMELDCSIALTGVSRFRVNVYQQRKGVGAVFRVIPSKIPTPQEIGLMPSVLKLLNEPRGLVVVTGPTGSGKSTTLASLVETINATQRKSILTIEDPIEFVYDDKQSIVLQREVGQNTKSFGEALRHALRQDPDVILVGEMRDLETIKLALSAAETGHLCFATLHTQDAPTSIDRIIDVFPPSQQEQIRVQVSTTLKAVISQVLMTKKGGQGRVCSREVMIMSSAVGSLIREGKTHMLYGAIESGAKHGMISMDQHLAFLVKQNLVEPQEALAKAHDAANLRALLQVGQPKQP
ncbi:MAG: type IV pilus twitching motility protein PilT [Elusimicrobiota bacterium]